MSDGGVSGAGSGNSVTEQEAYDTVDESLDKNKKEVDAETQAASFDSTVQDARLVMKAQKFANAVSLMVNLHSMIENIIAKIFQKLNNPG